jgi:hypothetical protein
MQTIGMKRLCSAGVVLAFSAAGALQGCGSDSTTDPSSVAGASASASAAGVAGSALAGGGSTGVSGSGGAASGAAGAALGGESGGGSSGTAGSTGGSSGGATSMAGLGGSAGLGAAGSAGSAGSAGQSGAGTSDSAAAAVLDKYQLLDPCDLSSYKVEASAGAVCPQTTAVKNQHVSLQFGGDAALTYDVTLHVRGIMEHYWFTGGTLDPTSKTFYTGGVPTVGGYSSACKNKTSELPFTLPTELSPTDNCWNGFNMFALAVSEPKTHYFLNYTTDKIVDRPPHAVYSDDYTVTIPIKGQAKLDFYVVGSDEHECYNHNQVISGVTLTSSPYIGEFVQFDVTKVSRQP